MGSRSRPRPRVSPGADRGRTGGGAKEWHPRGHLPLWQRTGRCSGPDEGGEPRGQRDDGIDFALAAFREDGDWQVQDLAHDQLGDVESISHALRRLPGDGGAVALVAINEDFFIIVRVAGASTRVLPSPT